MACNNASVVVFNTDTQGLVGGGTKREKTGESRVVVQAYDHQHGHVRPGGWGRSWVEQDWRMLWQQLKADSHGGPPRSLGFMNPTCIVHNGTIPAC